MANNSKKSKKEPATKQVPPVMFFNEVNIRSKSARSKPLAIEPRDPNEPLPPGIAKVDFDHPDNTPQH